MFDLNPLDVLKERKLDFLPDHFLTTQISNTSIFDNELEKWIQTKLKGRYCIINSTAIDNANRLKVVTLLGLEDQKEMTYFMLAYPQARR